ncbi:hypothetical protein ACFL0D_05480 [Thermoproteota archaeon]
MIVGMNDRKLVDSFRWGFLADRVFEILSLFQNDGILYEDDAHIIESAHDILMKILEGDEQVNSGIYSMNALEALKLYNRSIEIIYTQDFISLLAKIKDPELKNIIKSMDEALLNVKDKKKTEYLITTIKFFDLLRDLTLDESNNMIKGIYNNRGLRKWSSMPEII